MQARLLIQILGDHLWKMNHSTNRVQGGYIIRMCLRTSQFMRSSQHSLVTSILLSCHNQISRPFKLHDFGHAIFPDCSLTLAEFPDISRFRDIPEKW